MFKIMKGTAPGLVREMLSLNSENRYELRNLTDFTIQAVNNVRYGPETLTYLGPKSWETVPLNLKQCYS